MRKHGSLDSNITIPNNCYYIKYYHYSTNSEQLQLEYGDSISSYVEPILNKLDISLKEPLRSISDNIKDEIVYMDNKWYVNRKCKETLLDGDTSKFEYKVISHDSDFVRFAIKSSNDDALKTDGFNTIFCENIPLGTGNYRNRYYFNISGYADDSALFVGAIPISYLETLNSTGVANFFKKNPASVVYQLSESKLELLKTDINLDIYDEQTLIYAESIIPAKLEVTVDRVINKAVEAINIATISSTIDNISIARMWTNLAKESSIKDILQDDINNIVEIEDLKIDKKSATVNFDLYIKSKNALSMSLSTNNIVFDEYSSISDIEILDAVDITINSSLPYTLNASLETNIQSLDGSDILAPNIINIRESGNSYKPFINTADKLVLNDSCTAGTNNVHNIDLKLSKNTIDKAGVYKTTIKFEAIQK